MTSPSASGMPRGTSSSLIARKLNTSRRILCAAPAYLARRGTPQKPEDLRAARLPQLQLSRCSRRVASHRCRRRARGEGQRADRDQPPASAQDSRGSRPRHRIWAGHLFPRRSRCGTRGAGASGISIARSSDLRRLSGEPPAHRQGAGLQRFHGPPLRGDRRRARRPIQPRLRSAYCTSATRTVTPPVAKFPRSATVFCMAGVAITCCRCAALSK